MKHPIASLSLLAILVACGSSDGGSDAATPGADAVVANDVSTDGAVTAEDAPAPGVDVKGVFTISVDVKYPAGSVTAGFRPVAAVYAKADYSDFTKRPESIPQGALIGTEATDSLKGTLMIFSQTEPYQYTYGEYSVVLAVAAADSVMPLEGK